MASGLTSIFVLFSLHTILVIFSLDSILLNLAVMKCSIGSLGSGNSKAFVSDVLVNGAKLHGTQNGVRIKTWQVYIDGFSD